MEVLARYAGSYQEQDTPAKMKATISVSGDQLMFSIGGKGAIPLTTLSETAFYVPGGFPLDFVTDDKGTVTHFVLSAPGDEFKFVRTVSAKP